MDGTVSPKLMKKTVDTTAIQISIMNVAISVTGTNCVTAHTLITIWQAFFRARALPVSWRRKYHVIVTHAMQQAMNATMVAFNLIYEMS
jgi:hypothetical protein